jgi:hypothetical protein
MDLRSCPDPLLYGNEDFVADERGDAMGDAAGRTFAVCNGAADGVEDAQLLFPGHEDASKRLSTALSGQELLWDL